MKLKNNYKKVKKPRQIWLTCQKTNPNKSNIEK
jgi:hypothetical protein